MDRILITIWDAGTVVVPEDAFLANLRAVIAGFWNTGFRKQILLNGHGQEEVIRWLCISGRKSIRCRVS